MASSRLPLIWGAEMTTTDLLQRINRAIPAELQRRYSALIAQRQAEQLTPAEYGELLQLSARIEQIEAERVADLAALAQLRGVPLAQLINDLEIGPAVAHP